MSNDYIPRSDAELNDWLGNFTQTLSKINGHDQDAALATAHADWVTKFTDYKTKKAAAEAARQAKNEARQTLETAIRARARSVQADQNVSDATRTALGLNVRDETRTAAQAPNTHPIADID